MHAPSRGRTGLRAFALALVLGLAGLWVPQQSAEAAYGPFSGSASSDIVHVQALNLPDALELADVAVAPALAEMSSAGVPGGGNSHARALNVDADLLSAPDPAIPLDLIVDAEDRAPNPPPGPVVEELLNVPADPLLNATVAKATADAKWTTGGCVPVGTPISFARSELADANILTGTPLGDALASVHNSQGDTVHTASQTEFINVAGQTNKGVQATTTTQITAVRLFEGTANQLTINVLAPPVVTATATGKAGGAKVEYSEPVLQVLDADDNVIGELNAADANFELDASPLVTLRLGQLTKTTKSDGTEASGRAVLLEVIVLNPVPTLDPLARLTIAGGDVSVKVPSGGVDCSGAGGGGGGGGGGGDCAIDNPLKELQLGSSTLVAAKGSTFTYTISVSNRGRCTLTNVKVVDTIDGPEGSKVIDTDPEADEVDGLTVTWNDIGPLAPNQVKVLVVTVQVPTDAETGEEYTSEAKVTATGGGKNYAKGVKVELPTVAGPGSGSCNLTQSKVGPSHEEVKPGQTFNVYISLLNSGGEPCKVTVTLPIDDGLDFVACTHNCDHTDTVVTWVLTIPPGNGQTLTATLKVPNDATDGTVYEHVVTMRNGGTITRTAIGPTVSDSSILAPFPSAGGADVEGGAQLPRTGFEILRWIAVALGLIALGGVLREQAKATTAA